MDIGCSSGGFSDVLTKGNVKKDFSLVDVGYGHFDWKLRKKRKLFY